MVLAASSFAHDAFGSAVVDNGPTALRKFLVRQGFRICAIVLSMTRARDILIWLAILTIAALAIAVTGSVWGGIIVAALELGFVSLLRMRRQPR
jgi:hypothetical protein